GEGMMDRGPGTTADGDVPGGTGVGRGLEHRGIDHPHEGERLVIDQPQPLGDLAAGRTEQRAGGLRLTGGEEDAVAGGGSGRLEQTGLHGLGDVLGDRSGEGAVLLHQHVGEGLRSALLGPLRAGGRRGGWDPPARTTAPTYGAWNTRNGVSRKYSVISTSSRSKRRSGLSEPERRIDSA